MTNYQDFLKSASLAVMVFLAPMTAMAQVTVFHSPNDDGTAPAEIVEVAPGAHTLHIYLQTGSTPSTVDPCNAGDGDEICQWLVHVNAQGPITFPAFTPVGDVRYRLDPSELSATGGDFDLGQLGVFKLGDLAIDAQDAGTVTLAYGEVASADLSRVFVESGDLIMLPEPNTTIGLVAGIFGLAGLTRCRPRHVA